MKHNDEQDQISNLSSKEEVVLELLLSKPSGEMYGLEMVEMSAHRLKRGTIYVTLARMEDKGLVISRQEQEDPTRPGIARRLYSPTGHGRRVYSSRAQVQTHRFSLPDRAIPGAI